MASTNTTCGGGSSSVLSRVAAALGQHVDFVEDVHLVAAGRAECNTLDELAHVDAVVGGGVELVHVVAGATLDGQARFALATGLAVDHVLAVQDLGEDAGGGGLAGAAWPGEQVGLALAPLARSRGAP